MSELVFTPLEMARTTFNHEETLHFGLAQNFDLEGNTESFRWYTALSTSAEDLSIFICSQTKNGNQTLLSKETLTLMRTPHASQMGANTWGLRVMFYTSNNQGDYIVGHNGNNEPAINTTARLDPTTGDAILILSTGSKNPRHKASRQMGLLENRQYRQPYVLLVV